MCHNCTKNNKINRIPERCLHLLYNDKKLSFENILDKDKSISAHHKNLRGLHLKCIKYIVVFHLLRQADQYNLRNRSQFIIPSLKTVNHGFESQRYLGPKIWEIIPSH